MLDRIMQWNVRGVRSRHCELSLLMKDLDPSCLCLQELKLHERDKSYSISRLYKTYIKTPDNNQPVPRGGSMIAVKTSIPHHHIPLNTALQAVAVSFTSGKNKIHLFTVLTSK